MSADYSAALNPDARRNVLLLFLLASMGLFLVGNGRQAAWPGFDSPAVLTSLYTVLTVVPILSALLVEKAQDRLPWYAGALAVLVLVPLAVHTGHAVVPELPYANGSIYFRYYLVVSLACFVALPFVQAGRRASSMLHYPALYEYAWGNALTLAVGAAFALACWLILGLWAALFNLIGIGFFGRMFSWNAFAYPASGVFAGIGLILGRSQTAATRTLLNICLTLGRALFPLVAAVSLLFLAALAFGHLEPLWRTRHASTLLLVLVLAAVSLFNSIYQDGHQSKTESQALQRLGAACLLVLPLFAGIAGYALSLRVRQYGWTEERLWAALVTAFAGLYALSYAAATLRVRARRLPDIGRINATIGLALAAVLLLTQSPVLDLRRIAVDSLVAHALAPGADPAVLDLHYLRFDGGRPGNLALQALRSDPRVAGDSRFVGQVEAMLQQTNAYADRAASPDLAAADFTTVPTGTPIPDGLLAAIREMASRGNPSGLAVRSCASRPDHCLLVRLELSARGLPVRVVVPVGGGSLLPVLVQDNGGWHSAGYLQPDSSQSKELAAQLRDGHFSVAPSPWNDLLLDGGARLSIQQERSW